MAEMIPTRPNGYDYKGIKKADCDCLTAAVLLEIKNEDAFIKWHPEYLNAKGGISEHGKSVSVQFFNAPKHKEYTKAFKATIEDFCKGKGGVSASEPIEKRKDKAVSKLVSDCLDAINDNKDLDPEVLKDFVTMAKALGVLKDEQEQMEIPRRYLPERCSSCKYKQFIDENVKLGNIIEE